MLKIISMLAAITANSSYDASHINRQDVNCLATAVYHEARGEPIMGQVSVAHIVLNRVDHINYPDDVCGVVYQKSQFSYIEQAAPNYESKAWDSAVEAATFAILNIVDDPTDGADHYYNPALASPQWSNQMIHVATIGQHRFYKR